MSLPVPSRPTVAPPTGALPPIPVSKPPRKSLPTTSSRLKAPRPSLSAVSQQASSSPDVLAQESTESAPQIALSADQAIRRTISIGAFPHPPNAISRPPTASSMNSPISPRKRSSKDSTTSVRSRKPPRASTGSNASYRSEAPSLLNSAGEARSIPVLQSNKRASDGHSSGASPPHSRSSSADGSYSTSATTIDDIEEDRGRPKETADTIATGNSPQMKRESKGNVIVSVRVRPDTSGQDHSKSDGEWMVDGRRALIAHRGKETGDYHYDNVFGTYDDNAKVYDSAAKRLVRRVMEGYHGTVFAYGMTGTGKTFSMQGTMSSPGVIPLAITDIFSYIRETPHREFLLRVSYLEIYNEKIHDLLAAPVSGSSNNSQQEEIKLREDKQRGVYATPLKEEIVQSPTQLLRVIHRGDIARRTASTQFNARSSRSHAVVQIVVESRERVAAGTSQELKRVAMLPSGVRVSTLSLIDLAGSERAAEDKERRTEGAHINKSLLTLGTVIAKLSSNKDKNGNPIDKDGKHLPYRDSKLTRLLQPALSGNSLVSILCTIQVGLHGNSTTATNHTSETLNTLKFAARAKNNIVSHAKRATDEMGAGVNAGLLERYRAEIASLRAQLENQQKSSNPKEDSEEKAPEIERDAEKEAEQRHEEQMLEMQLARTALKERIEHLNRLILCSKSTGVNSGTMSSLGMHPRMSGGVVGEFGSRSVRSSASQSTLGTLGPSIVRHPSLNSVGGGHVRESAQMSFSAVADDDEDVAGEFGDGRATLQAQNRALQADLQDKNRYIATLEKRLLQARRSSHSRTSIGFSKTVQDENEIGRKLDEKDAQIADLQKTVTALRSAMRLRSLAGSTPDTPSTDYKARRDNGEMASDKEHSRAIRILSTASLPARTTLVSTSSSSVSPIALLSPDKTTDKKRKSVDEMSRMLDEMIQDKVESGHLIKGKTGSVRVPPRSSTSRHSRRNSTSTLSKELPPLATIVKGLRERDSVAEPSGSA